VIVCGTGHRPEKVGGYSADAWERLVELASFWVRNGLDKRTDHVISGMALGWDQALAMAAIKNNIPWSAYVPFAGQEKKWPESSVTMFHYLLDRAACVVECSEPGYAAWKMQHRNKRMVDDSDVVLALWDGSDGGTGNCIRYAKDKGSQIVNLWPVYELITNSNAPPNNDKRD